MFFWGRARAAKKAARSGYAGHITIAPAGRMLIRPYYPSRACCARKGRARAGSPAKIQTKHKAVARPLRAAAQFFA